MNKFYRFQSFETANTLWRIDKNPKIFALWAPIAEVRALKLMQIFRKVNDIARLQTQNDNLC